MLEIPLNTAVTLPVIIKDGSGDPVTGVLYSDVECRFSAAGGALGTLAITAGNWTEIGRGLYTIDFTTTEIDTEGWFTYIATSATAAWVQFEDTVNVVLKGQVFLTAAYNETTTDLVVRAWLEIDGQIVEAPTSCAVSIKDDTDVERFALTSVAPSADGFFTITETGPTLSDDHNYSCSVDIVYGNNTYTSGDCLLIFS